MTVGHTTTMHRGKRIMRKISRSLAAAVTTLAVAGITVAGAVPATAAPAKAAAASSAQCDSIRDAIRQHAEAGDKYTGLAKVEASKANPDQDKVAQYNAKAKAEYQAADAYQVKYAQQCS
ncbi:membrane protein [Streptomyces noursei ATCC 11455]|nr:membrane protein [Streptomyces noursei ATCC 11455]GGW84595.1 hypothetical protein GCM10010341_00700 [Streptomyces noursei]